MTNNTRIGEIIKYRLEDWVDIFGGIYEKADADRNASSLWLDVIEESSTVAEYVRREEYKKAIDTVPIVFSRLLSFVARYSINITDNAIQDEGIDLRPDKNTNLYLTDWVLKKYPYVCSVCAKKPCICPSTRYERERRNEDFEIAEDISTRLMKRKSWENEIFGKIDHFNVETLFNMFNEIYSGVHHDPPISSICFHFLEEVGEVAKLLLSFNNIQILKIKSSGTYEEKLKYLNNDLKGEISDVVSWIMALINKVNFIFRSTYPHYHCIIDLNKNTDTNYRYITLSELLLDRFYEAKIDKFICPYCKSEKCSPECKQNRLIKEMENKMRRDDDLMHEFRKAMGQEKRKCHRKLIDIRTKLENNDVHVVNIGKDNIGFLGNEMLSLNEVRDILIEQENMKEFVKFRITRPTNADISATGFQYFYGAEILERKMQSTGERGSPI